MKYRTEHDSLGKKKVPEDKYYGIQTLRAMENFNASGVLMSERPKLIRALAAIKQAAAMTNLDLRVLNKDIADAIINAAKEVYDGKFYDEFPVDMIQGGAGTSANMNANEVICNRALEIFGHKKGEYQYIHPLNHVNLSQSTNDVYPTAVKIAAIWMTEDLNASIESLRDEFFKKARKFKDIIKMGRTQLQDAVPMTLGQEFKAFGDTIDIEINRLKDAADLCRTINMGATAIGTGINTLPGYDQKVCKYLSDITGLELFEAIDLVEATSDTTAFVSYSSVLKRLAVKLTKICNDLRLLSSGPRAGFHDINLPAVQPGSSIMPGKVNPVIPEMVNQVCFQVIGCDLTIAMAASAGQLQLNAFEPIIAYNLFEAVNLFRKACAVLQDKCIKNITANVEHCRNEVLRSPGLVTAFSPYIGYEAAAEIAKKMEVENKSIYELVKESGLLSEEDIKTILSPDSMTQPHARISIIRKKNEKNI